MRSYFKLYIALCLSIFINGGCTSAGSKMSAQQPDSTKNLLEKFLSSKSLAHSTVAIKIIDLQSNEVLVSHNESLTVVPASVQKIFITAAALETFTPYHTFSTILSYSGEIDKEDVLHGDLYIIGGGDPTFGSPYFGDNYGNVINRLSDATKAAGIKKINGNIIGDASIFGEPNIPGTWIWEDIGNYFGAIPSGLNIYDNSYEIAFRSKKKPGTPTTILRITPEITGLAFENHVISAKDNRDNAWIFGSYLDNKRVITGAIPAGKENFIIKGAIPDPAKLVTEQLAEKLKTNGIAITGNTHSSFSASSKIQKRTLLEIKSPNLADIINKTNSKSVNLYADVLLMHLAATAGKPSLTEGGKILKSFWKDKGMHSEGIFLMDGSGSSRSNGVTADQIVFVLKYMNDSHYSEIFQESLATAGVSGTLRNFGKGSSLENNFYAKSGSMARIQSYAGYLTVASGKKLAIALIINNFDDEPAIIKNQIKDFLIEVYQNL